MKYTYTKDKVPTSTCKRKMAVSATPTNGKIVLNYAEAHRSPNNYKTRRYIKRHNVGEVTPLPVG